jgi:hypothetical protein
MRKLKQQCTAKSKHTQERCKNPAISGRTTCKFHGGRSLRGVNHPNYKHGKRAKNQYLPHPTAEILEELVVEEISSIQQSIEVHEALQAEHFQKKATGESGAAWKQINELAKLAAVPNLADGEKNALIAQIVEISTRGVGELAWNSEFFAMAELQRKLAESLVKIRKEKLETITQVQLMELLNQLLLIIKSQVVERSVVVKIQEAFVREVALLKAKK